jgi:hypothetical protein
VAAGAGSGSSTTRPTGWCSCRRLHQRWVSFIERRKRGTVANVAIARELAGWCWSLATLEQP